MQAHQRLKGFNLIYFGMLALFIPFLPVFLSEQGLTTKQIGFIVGTGGFVTIVTQPLWGMISDKTKAMRNVLLILLTLATILGYLLFTAEQFGMLVAFSMGVYFFLMAIDPLTESLNFTIAERAKISYGAIRTYGALGYALASLAAGYVMNWFGMSSIAIFFVVLGVLGIAIMTTMPNVAASSSPVTLGALATFFKDKKTVLFLVLVFISSVPARMNDTFLGVHIRALGGSTEQVGQAFFFAAGSEIIVFALSFWWLRKGKELLTITFAAFFFFVRFFVSAFVVDPQILALVQVLQMLTFPIFYTAAIQYLYRIVPTEWRATGQTILALLFFGVSGIIASYAGGVLYDTVSGQNFYFVLASISLISTLFGLILYRKFELK
ncbi:putative 3-phenylpropionic acid transporter [Metalysinibacillus saudimassiliensis]|uniref:Putative 3-phenylpropionic acid transporter n=1 Tax=Metalysinibacillus saudimassiliensis TaxID=1461583 RepID=A0A078M924_9BACL|nr:putative 3-phenylpropionic acid transporter [Metalysinibacillus saudimassiliensis]